MTKLFTKETELVAAFCECLGRARWRGSKAPGDGWTQYHETAGWDLLLANDTTGLQIGIEAKLSLNAKVLAQAMPNRHYDREGPDYRAVLVPADACQAHMATLAAWLGVTVIEVSQRTDYGSGKMVGGEWVRGDDIKTWHCNIELPQQSGNNYSDQAWVPWLPIKRCTLPDYVPDVVGGDSSPVALTPWKIKAIKLLILLERRGVVHRSDMRALDISPTRWCDGHYGYLARTPDGYVRCASTPDLKAQHPKNWTEIEADFDRWNPYTKLEQAA